MSDWNAGSERILDRLDALAKLTDEPGKITRTFLSPAMHAANQLVATWMEEAGLRAVEDYAGNLVGEVPGANGKPVFLLGSHLDTVRDAGEFDGPLGVLLGIEAYASLQPISSRLPFSLAVAGFAEEEGVRFQSAYLGSKAFCGLVEPQDLQLADEHGLTLGALLEEHRRKSNRPLAAWSQLSNLRGYLEVHMEQGPVLEEENRPVGVVSAISGQTRVRVEWSGSAAHAGTTPSGWRRDALAGAAVLVGQAEAAMHQFPGLRATVGELRVAPNVSNVIPARVTHTLDIRHAVNKTRIQATDWLQEQARGIADARKLRLRWEFIQQANAVPCDEQLSAELGKVIAQLGSGGRPLPSGAGHDGVILARKCPIAMLFVRCRGGLSHHPDEFVSLSDIETALRTVVTFFQQKL